MDQVGIAEGLRCLILQNDRIPAIFNIRCWAFNVRRSFVSFSIKAAVVLAGGPRREPEPKTLNPTPLNLYPERHAMAGSYYLNPVGIVRKSDARIWLEIYDEFADGLLGLDGFSHIYVLFWFHENDSADKRRVLQVHPRGDNSNPLTGVFGTHSPLRPNLIGLTLCKIVAIKGNRIEIEAIDAIDGSPIVDIKCYIPDSISNAEVRMPDWV